MIWRFGGLSLDDGTREIRRGERRVSLEPKAFSLLVALLRAHPEAVPRDRLIAELWPGIAVTPNSLNRAVSIARQTLDAAGADKDTIRTVHGFGYALASRVERVGTESNPPVAREASLAVLADALARARVGHGSLVLVEGDPGIGKTHLIEHFASAVDAPALVIKGHAVEGDTPPFWEWRNVVRRCVDALEPNQRESLGAVARRSLLAIAPELDAVFDEADDGASGGAPQPSPAQLWDDVARLVRQVSRAQLVVGILEDLHWSRPESLQLLHHVVREVLSDSPVLLVATYRGRGAPDRGALDAALSQLVPLPTVRPIVRLEPFAAAEVGQLLERNEWLDGRRELVEPLTRWTGGNPLFVREVVRLIESSGGELPWRSIPPSLDAVVRERVGRLKPSTQEILRVAAVIGGERSPATLAHIVRRETGEVDESLAEAERAVLVERHEAHAFSFVHELVRDALRAQASHEQRAEIHRAAADAIEALYADWLEPRLAELSAHLYLARPLVDEARVARFASAAGRQALERCALSEAVRHLRRAAETQPASGPQNAARRCDMLLDLAEAETLLHHGPQAKEALDEASAIARQLDDGPRTARAALAQGAWAIPILADASAIETLEEAIERLGSERSDLRLRLLAQLALQRHFAGDREGGARLLDEVLAESDRIDDPALRASLLIAHLMAVQQGACHEPPHDRLALADTAIDAALGAGRADWALETRRLRISILSESGEREALDADVAFFARDDESLRARSRRYYAAAFRANRHLLACEFDAAREQIERALRIADPLDLSECLFTPTTQRMLLPLTEPEAEGLLETIAGTIETVPGLRGWRTAPAYVHQQLGRSAAVRRSLDDNLREGVEAFLVHNMTDTTVLAAVTEASHWVGDARHATELLGLLEPYAGRNVDVGWGVACYGPIDYYRALAASLLGRREEAISHFESAEAMNDRMGARLWQIRNRLAWAKLLCDAGLASDRDRARALARSVASEASAVGLRREATESEALTRRLA